MLQQQKQLKPGVALQMLQGEGNGIGRGKGRGEVEVSGGSGSGSGGSSSGTANAKRPSRPSSINVERQLLGVQGRELVANRMANDEKTTKIRWKQGVFLGQGSFSKVFCALNEDTGEVLAVKYLKMEEARIEKLERRSASCRNAVIQTLCATLAQR